MKPQKKSYLDVVVAILAFFAVVYISLQCGIALNDIDALEAERGVVLDGFETYDAFFTFFELRMANPSFSFEWTENIKTALTWGGFLWLITVMWWFTSKHKFITGKEYGTSRWATIADIVDLFAENLMKAEIKQAKQVRTVIGRYFAKRKVYKACRANAEKMRVEELKRLERWKVEAIPEGKWLTREERQQKKDLLKKYADDKAKIEAEAKETYQQSIIEAWKPNKLKQDYEIELADIAYRYQQGIEIISETEKLAEEKAAKERYSKGLRDFFSGKDRMQKIRKKYEDADAIFTKTEHISIYNYMLNNNTLIMGGSGSGKTRGYVMPNILQAHSSYVITDPKGEILEKAGYFLEKIKGYKIHVLNLDDKSKSDGYNPFAYIHPERPGYEERVLSLIEAIIINTDDGEKKGGSDPFWPKAERLFLQSVFFFTCDAFPPEEQNMNTVQKLIKMLKIGEEEDNHDSDLDYFVQIFKEDHGPEHIGVQQYEEFREKASGKTAKSIVISAVARLAPFKTSEVRRIFSYDTMQLDRLGEEKTAVFVVVPPTDTTFNFIAGMLFTQMFQELQYCATQVHKHHGQRLPVPVRFILDEFKNTCTIPNFIKILAYARSFGIGIVPILQSLEQIKEMYEKEWGVVIDNCSTLLYLGSIQHMDTLKYMSELLGKGTFEKQTQGRTRGKQGSTSQNIDVIGRELMLPSEIREMPKKDCLFVVSGRPGFYSEKYNYEDHPNYRFTSDANHAYSYEYTPPERPKPLSEIREERHHRDNEQKERVAARVQAIMAQIDKEVDKISLTIDPQKMLNRIGQSFVHYAPVSDDILHVDDGEAMDDGAVMEALGFGFKQQDVYIDALLGEDAQKRAQEILARVDEDVKENAIKLETNPVEVAKKVIAVGENLAPITDDVLEIDDGTEYDDDEFEFEEETEEPPASDDFGDIGDALAPLVELMEQAEENNAENAASA